MREAITDDITRRQWLTLSAAMLAGAALAGPRLAAGLSGEPSLSALLRGQLVAEIALVQRCADILTAAVRSGKLEEYRGYISQAAAELSRLDPLADLQEAFYRQRVCMTHVIGFAELMTEQRPDNVELSADVLLVNASGTRLLARIEQLERRYFGEDLLAGAEVAAARLVANCSAPFQG